MLALAGKRVRWSSRVKTRAAVGRPSTSSEIEQVASAQVGNATSTARVSPGCARVVGTGRPSTRIDQLPPEGGRRLTPCSSIGARPHQGVRASSLGTVTGVRARLAWEIRLAWTVTEAVPVAATVRPVSARRAWALRR
ncbi:hypothetical protein D3C87_1552630 [compost metagenome]